MSKKKNELYYVPASAKTAAQKEEEAKKNRKSNDYRNLTEQQKSKLLKKRIWTLSVVTLSLVLVLTLSLIFATYSPTLYEEKGNTAPDIVADEGIIKNEEFSLSKLIYNGLTSDNLQYPYIPSSWTVSSDSHSIAGIISRKGDEKEKVKKSLLANGVAQSDIDTLLEASDLTSEDANADVMLFYNSTASYSRIYSNSFTVPASGYLEIKVRIRSSVTSGGAFIGFKTSTSSSADWEKVFTGINTNGEWKEYSFYIEGSKTSSTTVYLHAGLGTSDEPVAGWAEIDYAKAENTKKVTYMDNAELSADNVKTISYVKESSSKNLFGTSFNPSMIDRNDAIVSPVKGSDFNGELPFADSDNIDIFTVDNSSNANASSKYMKFGTKFTVQQSSATPYYRFSFWAKTEQLQNNTGAYFYANVYVNGVLDQSKCVSFSLVKTSTASDDVNSGWEEFSFLLQPSNNGVYEIEFIFSLGDIKPSASQPGKYDPVVSDLKTTGKLHVTEFELKEIYQSEYSSASAGDNIQKVSVSSTTSTGLITNGNFDSPITNAYVTGTDIPTGLDPNGWSIKVPRTLVDGEYVYAPHGSSDLSFGIVSNNSSNKNEYFTGGDTDSYFSHIGKDNVLGVNLKTNTAIGFVSNKFTLEANSYYIISFIAKGNCDNFNAYLTGDIECAFDLTSLTDDTYFAYRETDGSIGEYSKYNIVIKTGDSSKSVALELWVGNKDASYSNQNGWTGLAQAGSYVAFDEAKTETLTEDEFNEIVNSKNGEENVFTKTETKGTEDVEDEDGNVTQEEVIKDVTYTTEMKNVWVRDLTYADKSDAIPDDGTEDEEDPAPAAPVDWLLLSSLIFSLVVVVFVVTMIVKKFTVKKKPDYTETQQYKK